LSEEITNRVANSKLITIDLEDHYPEGKRIVFDISEWLYEGIILKEKDFRKHVKEHNWSQYQDKYVALACKTEAIIPFWAYLLITTVLSSYAKKIVVGSLALLETIIFQEVISNLNLDLYRDKPIIIKGCSAKMIPQTIYIQLVEKLRPIAKSILYGEACSSVPLYKTK